MIKWFLHKHYGCVHMASQFHKFLLIIAKIYTFEKTCNGLFIGVNFGCACFINTALLCFAVKKFCSLTSFLLSTEKLSQLPVILLILGTLDSNIHGKTFVVTKHSAKAIYGISKISVYACNVSLW